MEHGTPNLSGATNKLRLNVRPSRVPGRAVPLHLSERIFRCGHVVGGGSAGGSVPAGHADGFRSASGAREHDHDSESRVDWLEFPPLTSIGAVVSSSHCLLVRDQYTRCGGIRCMYNVGELSETTKPAAGLLRELRMASRDIAVMLLTNGSLGIRGLRKVDPTILHVIPSNTVLTSFHVDFATRLLRSQFINAADDAARQRAQLSLSAASVYDAIDGNLFEEYCYSMPTLLVHGVASSECAALQPRGPLSISGGNRWSGSQRLAGSSTATPRCGPRTRRALQLLSCRAHATPPLSGGQGTAVAQIRSSD